jgi:hypothetical protein
MVLVPGTPSRAGPKGRRDGVIRKPKRPLRHKRTTPQQKFFGMVLKYYPHRRLAPLILKRNQGKPAFGVLMPDNQTLFDSAHTALSIGNNLVWLRQPRFFRYSK